jgi:hypothetical protein
MRKRNLCRPGIELNVPELQNLQRLVPVVTALYLPAAQDVHWADVLIAVATLPYVPRRQPVHAEVPVVQALVPSSWHMSCALTEVPRRQVQL